MVEQDCKFGLKNYISITDVNIWTEVDAQVTQSQAGGGYPMAIWTSGCVGLKLEMSITQSILHWFAWKKFQGVVNFY